METYSVQAVLSVTDRNFTLTMSRAADSMEGLDSASRRTTSSIQSIAKGMGAFKALSIAAEALKDSLSGAVSRFDTMNQFPKVMQQIGFRAKESEASINKLSDGIQGVPTSLDEITASTQKLALLTGDLGKATDASIALNNAFYASGSSSADASRGLVQYTQMLSKGTVDIVSWRTLQETMGVALRDLAEAFGYAGSAATTDLYAALQSGEITFDQLNDKLIELDGGVNGFAERAKTASAGIGTSLTNMGIAVTRGMESMIRSTNEALENNGLPGFQTMIEEATSGINKAFSAASEGIGLLVSNLDTLVPVLGTATAGFVAYKAAMSISSGLTSVTRNMAMAVDTLEATANASKLAEAAALARAKANKTAELADRLCQKSAKASATAIKSKAAAEKLSEAAAQARTLADAGGAEATGLKAAADKMEAAAARAQANANRDAARAETLKRAAENADTRATILNTAAEGANTVAETAGAKAATVSSIAIAAKTALLGVLSGKLGLVAAAQMVWNAAMNASPVGVIVVTTAALATALVGVSKALEKLDTEAAEARKKREETISSSKELLETLESTEEAYKENVSGINAEATANDKLAGKIGKLAGKEGKSADEKSRLKSCVEALNSSMEGLNLQYDEENDALNMSIDQIKAKVAAYKAQADAQAAQERYVEVLKEQSEIAEQLASIENERNVIEKEHQDLNQLGPKAIGEYNKAILEMTEQEKTLNEKKKELAASEKYLTDTMEQCQAEQTEAVTSAQEQQRAVLAESIADQTVSLEQLSEANQETVNTLNEVWQDYTDKATDMFDTLSDKQTMSVDKMISNIQKNQEVIAQWGDNMESLRDRFENLQLSKGVLDDLADMGPEGAGYVAALANASDEQLQILAQSFDNGGIIAKESLLESLGVNGDEIPVAIQNMFTQVESSLRETIAGTDWAAIGDDLTSGLSGGIDAGADVVADSAGNLGTDAENALRDTTQTHSPSVLFESIGQDLVAGLAQGLTDSGIATEAAVQMSESVVQAVQAAMDGADFSSAWDNSFSRMAAVATNNMSKVTSAVKSGMSASTTAASTGASSMQRVMNTGMTSMSAVVKTKMAEINRHGEAGMRCFENSVESGMNQSRATVSRGMSGMVSTISSMQSQFYNSGYHASIGLANGINAGAGAAIAAAKRLANQIASTMRDALEIHSPSRVTREIGGYTTEGFVEGLLDDIRAVKDAAIRIGKTALPDYGSSGRAAYAGGYDLRKVYDSQGCYDTAYTVVVPLEVNGREFAKATAIFTQKELDSMKEFENHRKGYRG